MLAAAVARRGRDRSAPVRASPRALSCARRHVDCQISPPVIRACCASRAPQPFRGDCAMDLIIWLIVGGIVGWLASVLMHTDARQGIFLNIIVGIVGAALAGFFISPLVGLPTINQGVFSFGSLVVSLVGAVILLAVVNLLRRGAVR